MIMQNAFNSNGRYYIVIVQGVVKLADFGVAAKLGELEEHSDELNQDVAGTPYWMAPEVCNMLRCRASCHNIT